MRWSMKGELYMDIFISIIGIAAFVAVIAFIVRSFSKNENQMNKSEAGKSDVSKKPFSDEYYSRTSAAINLAKATLSIVQSKKNLEEAKYLFCTDVACADSVFFSCFVLRALCIMSTKNRTAAEQFSDTYISCIVKMTGNEFLQEETAQKMFDNRTEFYDRIIIDKGGLTDGLPALLQEFELIIQTDMIEKKYVPFSSSSPLPLIGIFDAMQCHAEVNSFFQILLEETNEEMKQAMDSIQ